MTDRNKQADTTPAQEGEDVGKKLPTNAAQLVEEYKQMALALERLLDLPDSRHFLHFIDGPSGPVNTPSAIAYRAARHSLNKAKVSII